MDAGQAMSPSAKAVACKSSAVKPGGLRTVPWKVEQWIAKLRFVDTVRKHGMFSCGHFVPLHAVLIERVQHACSSGTQAVLLKKSSSS